MSDTMQYGIQSTGKTPAEEALLDIAHLENNTFTPHAILFQKAIKIAKEKLKTHCNIDVGGQ